MKLAESSTRAEALDVRLQRLLKMQHFPIPRHPSWCAGSNPALPRAAHDRLVLVERGVEHHRHAGQLAERLDQPVIARVGLRDARSAAGRSRRRA